MLDPDYITENTSIRESSYAELTVEALFKKLNYFVKHLDLIDAGKIAKCSDDMYNYHLSESKRLREAIREHKDFDIEKLKPCQRELLVNKRALKALIKKCTEAPKQKSQVVLQVPKSEIPENTTIILKKKPESISISEVILRILQIIPDHQDNAKTFGFFAMNIQEATAHQLQSALDDLINSGKIFRIKQKSSVMYFAPKDVTSSVQKCFKSEIIKFLNEAKGQMHRVQSIAFSVGLPISETKNYLEELRSSSKVNCKFINIAGKPERHYCV